MTQTTSYLGARMTSGFDRDRQTGLSTVAALMALEAQIDARCRAAPAGTDGYGIVLIDVEDMRGINHEHGFDFGEQVLVSIADRLRAMFAGKPVCCAARIGGDEFAVLVDGLAGEGRLVAARAEDQVRGHRIPGRGRRQAKAAADSHDLRRRTQPQAGCQRPALGGAVAGQDRGVTRTASTGRGTRAGDGISARTRKESRRASRRG